MESGEETSTQLVSQANQTTNCVDRVSDWLDGHARTATTLWLCNWNVQGLAKLAPVFEKHETLIEIGLGRGSDLKPEDVLAMAESMRCHNFKLKKLFINDQSHLKDEGVVPIMSMVGDFFFGRYSRLEELSLRNTGMGDRACQVLHEGLALNVKLRVLNLEDNSIGDDGAMALAEALKRNETLEFLNLGGNKIRSEGAAKLAHTLRRSTKQKVTALKYLNLDLNLITSSGGSAIAKCLTACMDKYNLVISCELNPIKLSILDRIRKMAKKTRHVVASKVFSSNNQETVDEVEVKAPIRLPPLKTRSYPIGAAYNAAPYMLTSSAT